MLRVLLACSIVLFTAIPDAFGTEPASSPGVLPRLGLAVAVDSQTIEVQVSYSQWADRHIQSDSSDKQIRGRTELQVLWVPVTYSLDDIRYERCDGSELSRAALLKELQQQRLVVLVNEPRHEVEPTLFKAFKPESILLIFPPVSTIVDEADDI